MQTCTPRKRLQSSNTNVNVDSNLKQQQENTQTAQKKTKKNKNARQRRRCKYIMQRTQRTQHTQRADKPYRCGVSMVATGANNIFCISDIRLILPRNFEHFLHIFLFFDPVLSNPPAFSSSNLDLAFVIQSQSELRTAVSINSTIK